eukprot:GHVO01040161.1.p1 GENE.GHVO01040161.1~~GHVO01040161.1.p1  ORF type:complete len:471 (+),score=59.86 GHVO01040161.1:74-1486(+)
MGSDRHMRSCVVGILLALAGHIRADMGASFSLAGLQKSQAIGNEAVHILKADKVDQDSCWMYAKDVFEMMMPSSCTDINDDVKSLASLSLTECHLRGRMDSKHIMSKCDIRNREGIELDKDNYDHEALHSLIMRCKEGLTDTAFIVYIEFFNHIENLCFFVQSALWQQRTEETVRLLSTTATHVMEKLSQASLQHDELLKSQKQSLRQQEMLLADSQRLSQVIADGQADLSNAFGDMREEVAHEQKRIRDAFSEAFGLITKILDFQKMIARQVTEIGSVLTYSLLVVVTYYITAADCGRHIRNKLYILWFTMLIMETFLLRVFDPTDTVIEAIGGKDAKEAARIVVTYWRRFGLSLGICMYIRSWWCYRNPTERIIEAMENSFVGFQRSLTENILREIQVMTPRYDSGSRRHFLTNRVYSPSSSCSEGSPCEYEFYNNTRKRLLMSLEENQTDCSRVCDENWQRTNAMTM